MNFFFERCSLFSFYCHSCIWRKILICFWIELNDLIELIGIRFKDFNHLWFELIFYTSSQHVPTHFIFGDIEITSLICETFSFICWIINSKIWNSKVRAIVRMMNNVSYSISNRFILLNRIQAEEKCIAIFYPSSFWLPAYWSEASTSFSFFCWN